MSLIQEGLRRAGGIGHNAVDFAEGLLFDVVTEEGPVDKAVGAYAQLLSLAKEKIEIITPRLNDELYADPRIVNFLRQALTRGVQVSIVTGAESEENAMEALKSLPGELTLLQRQEPHLEDSNGLPTFFITVDGRHVCISIAHRWGPKWIEGNRDFPPTVRQNDNFGAASRLGEKFASLASTAQEIPLR